MNPENPTPPVHDEAFREMMELFEDQTVIKRFKRMLSGLKAPKDSGAYKYARTELQRQAAPLAAVLVPLIAAVLLAVVAVDSGQTDRDYVTEIMEADTIEELDKIEEFLEQPQDFEPVDVTFTPDIAMNTPAPTPDAHVSPKPAEFNAVAMVRSPIVLRGIYGGRTTGQRGSMLAQFGGNRQTEEAVMRTLRWLKHTQLSDGSWTGQKTAMAALGILCFLAHGEKPDSEEFGESVQRAIQFLIDTQRPDGWFQNQDGHNYSHPMAAYALCEAYGLTLNPNVRDVAERAMVHVIRGQQANGGWNYKLNPAPNPDGTFRSDTSYMGWCVQAIKAAQMAGLHVEGLEEAARLSIRGFQGNAHPEGGFGYTSRGRTGLSGIGVLALQLMGAARSSEARNTMQWLEQGRFSFENWDKQPYGGRSPSYYWYYITQAKFHAGGQTWTAWNAQFNPELVKAQTVIPAAESGYKDHTGTPRDIGFWRSPSENEAGNSKVLDTTLFALQLMVYYRYLPTFQTPDVIPELSVTDEPGEIQIDVMGL